MSKVTKVAVFVTELQNCRAELQDTSGPSWQKFDPKNQLSH
jgi:hypothetical protein